MGKMHASPTDTEREAAEAIAPRVGIWRWRVLQAIAASRDGLTDWEIHKQTGGLLYTVAPRRVELLEAGLIEDSGRRRRIPTGRRAIVWVVTYH